MDAKVPHDSIAGTKIGFLADTHIRQEDGGDLPPEVLAAFAGVDLIVHLGDMGQQGVLDRLATVAPVLATRNTRADPTDGGVRIAERSRVIEVNGVRIGAIFELVNGLETRTEAGQLPPFTGTVESLAIAEFGEPVDVVAFGGTHAELQEERDSVLFFNPGSPTLPATKPRGELGTVAVLDVSGQRPVVQLVSLQRREGS